MSSDLLPLFKIHQEIPAKSDMICAMAAKKILSTFEAKETWFAPTALQFQDGICKLGTLPFFFGDLYSAPGVEEEGDIHVLVDPRAPKSKSAKFNFVFDPKLETYEYLASSHTHCKS